MGRTVEESRLIEAEDRMRRGVMRLSCLVSFRGLPVLFGGLPLTLRDPFSTFGGRPWPRELVGGEKGFAVSIGETERCYFWVVVRRKSVPAIIPRRVRTIID